jgi:hypothetical protein
VADEALCAYCVEDMLDVECWKADDDEVAEEVGKAGYGGLLDGRRGSIVVKSG